MFGCSLSIITKIFIPIHFAFSMETVFLVLVFYKCYILLCCELHWHYRTSLAAVPNIILGKVHEKSCHVTHIPVIVYIHMYKV